MWVPSGWAGAKSIGEQVGRRTEGCTTEPRIGRRREWRRSSGDGLGAGADTLGFTPGAGKKLMGKGPAGNGRGDGC